VIQTKVYRASRLSGQLGGPGGDARRSTGLEPAPSIAVTGRMVTANAGVDRQRAASHNQKKQ